ncbi:MAG: rhomboid family intramembrane serine protease [Myxococcales bacterium]|nr:rhomboid family intramembrane serine protease [Myxococcales bacterium]
MNCSDADDPTDNAPTNHEDGTSPESGNAARIGSELPITQKKREADDWALVLMSEGIASTILRITPVGGDIRRPHRGRVTFTVTVAPEFQERARGILDAWRIERAERALRIALPIPRGATTLETAMAYAFALTLLAFHLGLKSSGRWEPFIDLGRSQAVLVLEGQWWRLVTALSLHADIPHVLGNTLFGGFFLAAVAGRVGIGFALLGFLVSGTLGNLANALYYGSAHSSIGASTGVFGLVGILAGLAAWRRHHLHSTGRGAWVAFAAGLGIVAMLGSGGPRVDFTAHLFGLAAGGLAGVLVAIPLASRPEPGRIGQGIAMFLTLTCFVGAWHFARTA